MSVRRCVVCLFAVGVTLPGCTPDEGSEAVPQAAVVGPINPRTFSTPTENQSRAATPEADRQDKALQKLKAGLDSWVFGDSPDRFKKSHPDILFPDADWLTRTVLLRYEIGPVRTVKNGRVEVAVTLVFQSRAGTEIKQSKTYTVSPPNEKSDDTVWTVFGSGA